MASTPKSREAIERDYVDCIKNGVLKNVQRDFYQEYVTRSQKDTASAHRDLVGEDYYWSVIKAYQALFFMLNALLVKYKGYFSKDHRCIITALLKEQVISVAVADRIDSVIRNIDVFKLLNDVDDLRLDRNKAMYSPTAWKDFKKKQTEFIFEEARNLINSLLELI